MKLKRVALAVGLSSLLAGLAFPASAQDAGWDSVVAAAKKEGKVSSTAWRWGRRIMWRF
jgi:hypothetical protein